MLNEPEDMFCTRDKQHIEVIEGTSVVVYSTVSLYSIQECRTGVVMYSVQSACILSRSVGQVW